LDAFVKVYNRSSNYHVGYYESVIILLKIILYGSGLQTHATVMKEKNALVNLPELMVRLTHNVSKLNLQVLTTNRSLKQNGSSAPDLLRQLFRAYITLMDTKFNN